MKMRKRKFRIGELAKKLNVEKFVIRFWEKEFGLKTDRSNGGQRFYEEKNYEQFKLIKNLLYNQGFTIAGAKKVLNSESTKIIASKKTSFEQTDQKSQLLSEQIVNLRKKLLKLKELL